MDKTLILRSYKSTSQWLTIQRRNLINRGEYYTFCRYTAFSAYNVQIQNAAWEFETKYMSSFYEIGNYITRNNTLLKYFLKNA